MILIAKTQKQQILTHQLVLSNDLDETKSRGPDGIPPSFIENLAALLSKALNLIFRNIKRQKRIPNVWKISAISPSHKKSSNKDVKLPTSSNT